MADPAQLSSCLAQTVNPDANARKQGALERTSPLPAAASNENLCALPAWYIVELYRMGKQIPLAHTTHLSPDTTPLPSASVGTKLVNILRNLQLKTKSHHS